MAILLVGVLLGILIIAKSWGDWYDPLMPGMFAGMFLLLAGCATFYLMLYLLFKSVVFVLKRHQSAKLDILRSLFNFAFVVAASLVIFGAARVGGELETGLQTQSMVRGNVLAADLNRFHESKGRYPGNMSEFLDAGFKLPVSAIRDVQFEVDLSNAKGPKVSFASVRHRNCHRFANSEGWNCNEYD